MYRFENLESCFSFKKSKPADGEDQRKLVKTSALICEICGINFKVIHYQI